ncbi:hypothetical protein [Streptomyces phaeoluteigriseus]|uniref:hypothetical protein n=1 Tax=Streptomyces phaeoluteigriseus TaxID=114686 RepID=UPI0014749D4F|nr:hypothetical protein [Streptomyces phaeoluteigriseus]
MTPSPVSPEPSGYPSAPPTAAQADLLDTLPGIHLPDLDQLRDRGVLGSQPPTSPSQRRTLGAGDHPTDEPAS